MIDTTSQSYLIDLFEMFRNLWRMQSLVKYQKKISNICKKFLQEIKKKHRKSSIIKNEKNDKIIHYFCIVL